MKRLTACFLTGGISEEVVNVAKKYGLRINRIPVHTKPEDWNIDECDILIVHTEFLPGDIREDREYFERLSLKSLPKLCLLTSWIPSCPPTFYDFYKRPKWLGLRNSIKSGETAVNEI